MPAQRRPLAPSAKRAPRAAPKIFDPAAKPANRSSFPQAALTMSIGYKRDNRPGLYCIELRTTQWEQTVKWYREVLGLRVLVRAVDDGYALFEAGETRISILARQQAGEASARWSLGFEVDNLDLVARRLEEASSPVSRPARNPEGFQEILTNDPDGNTVRLFMWPNA
jgi:predicted enzyme related to lactoylglutathione lyase